MIDARGGVGLNGGECRRGDESEKKEENWKLDLANPPRVPRGDLAYCGGDIADDSAQARRDRGETFWGHRKHLNRSALALVVHS